MELRVPHESRANFMASFGNCDHGGSMDSHNHGATDLSFPWLYTEPREICARCSLAWGLSPAKNNLVLYHMYSWSCKRVVPLIHNG
jgi:hypothetical protein